MDLIYMSADREDIGVMNDYTFDLAYGSEENDFECKIVRSNHCCEEGFFLYYEGTEYGGIIDDIGVDTEADEVTYYGRTWHGILNSKVLAPDAGEDHLIVSGEVNEALGSLISRMDLSDLFIASTEDSGITIPSYQMNRYIEGYDGIRKMLKASGLKLNMVFKNGFVELSAKPIVDYSKDEQFDKDQTAFVVNQKGHPINHVICLGKGDLAEREVIHVYADRNGKISETQVFTGIEEVVAIYENTNAEDSEKLKQGGIDIIKEAWTSDEVDVTFNFDDENFDIGDIVGADDAEIGVVVRKEITKKIVSIKNGEATVSYPTDNSGKTNTSSRGGSSGGGSDNPSTGGGTANLVEIYEADYENLSDIEKNDDTVAYFVPDGEGGGGSSSVRSHVGMIIHTSTLDTMEKVIAIYGGTVWEKIEGVFLLGQSATYAIGSTGGESEHTLTIGEMPSHNHTSTNGDSSFVTTGSGSTAYVDTSGGGYVVSKIANTGGSQPHNNMPPYKVVYIWERTQ